MSRTCCTTGLGIALSGGISNKNNLKSQTTTNNRAQPFLIPPKRGTWNTNRGIRISYNTTYTLVSWLVSLQTYTLVSWLVSLQDLISLQQSWRMRTSTGLNWVKQKFIAYWEYRNSLPSRNPRMLYQCLYLHLYP